MNWLTFRNLTLLELSSIPELSNTDFNKEIKNMISSGMRLVNHFAAEEDGKIKIYSILADDSNSKLLITSTTTFSGKSLPSLTKDLPMFNLFEREIKENFNIGFEEHPWLKPVRDGVNHKGEAKLKYDFFKIDDEEVHEVGVGPIHAGIIEPGHFRFLCHGEEIFNLEIQHGFQKRGIEKLLCNDSFSLNKKLKISESIAGDTVIGHSMAFANIIEALSKTKVSQRVLKIRAVMLELERLANHIGDLSALATDIGYLTGNSIFGAIRTEIINTSLAICGNRFGRNMIALGGVHYDVSSEMRVQIISLLSSVDKRVQDASEVMLESSSVLSRFEKTGIVNYSDAKLTNLVGPAARASGVAIDSRADHPFGAYQLIPFHLIKLEDGDVLSRFHIRIIEIQQSIKIITSFLNDLDDGELTTEINNMQPNSFISILVEGWRGEIIHTAITDSQGKIYQYKVKDPSFTNWTGLELAVKKNGISDFPLCNKSFNLSYSGFDL